ncbi:ABC transporter permease [Bauldia sp.]|uniref:ABC transporter permease n=1 Tax=Bauldia sp. TaxID=2575872 RepID=UPI003BA9869F
MIALVVRRVSFLFVVIWTASTITFFVPRLSERNPIRERFAELARTGGFSPADLEAIIDSFSKQFGLDKPLFQQYLDYIWSVVRLDFGFSLNSYPATVTGLIAQSLPWTIGLLLVTTIISFVIGNLFGAIAAWPRAPAWSRNFALPFVLFMGVPPVLMGVLLVFFLGFQLQWLPLGGAYSIGIVPEWTLTFALDMLRHQVLPALALILGTIGLWVLTMRGMGITIQGEDYVNFAEHKGLSGFRIFRDYYLRNALLPQVTALALALGTVITSAIIVEAIFSLPGVGLLLINAIRANDFPVIYGIVLFITISVAVLMTLLEFLYPILDPRIRAQ